MIQQILKDEAFSSAMENVLESETPAAEAKFCAVGLERKG